MDSSPLRTPWFPKLRWCAFAGQVVLIATGSFVLGMPLPLATLFGALAVLAISNIFLERRATRGGFDDRLVGAVLLLDTALLTVMLAVTGGPMNPFTIIYLVHVVLAAVMLGVTWTWIVAASTSVAFAVLFFLAGDPVTAGAHAHSHGMHMALHLHGMLGAFLIAAGLTALFLTRIIAELRERDRRLERLAGNQERLATLTTLAAGAAHELGTPLNTIALVVEELEEAIRLRGGLDDWAEELGVVRDQLDRCSQAVTELVASAGGMLAERAETISGSDLMELVIRGLPKAEEAAARGNSRVRFDQAFLDTAFVVPRRAFAHALRMVVKNGLESGSDDVRVGVDAETGKPFRITVTDSGSGIAAELLGRLGEPFLTTKSGGRGLGLGVFIARLVADRLKGRLSYESRQGHGTVASFVLPVDCFGGAAHG